MCFVLGFVLCCFRLECCLGLEFSWGLIKDNTKQMFVDLVLVSVGRICSMN